MKPIDAFVLAVRRRLNGYRAMTTFLWALGVGAAILLGVAASYLFRGEAVPKTWYGITGGATLLAAFVGILLRRLSFKEASEFADGYFNLHDSLTSVRRFDQDGAQGGFYDLSRMKTEEAVQVVSPDTIRYPFPRRLGVVSLLLVLIAGSTAFIPPSQEVLDRLAQEEATEEATEDIKEELLTLIEELERATEDPLERELLNADQLRQWVEELQTTRDLKQAMRQFAGLERQLAQAANRLSQRRDEQLLAKAGAEVKQDSSNRQLGEKLESQKFREAGEELQNLLPKPQPELSQELKELTRLRAAAKRMATAARNARSARSAAATGQSDGQSDDLEDLLEQLEQEVDGLNDDLEEMEQMERLGQDAGDANDRLNEGRGDVGDQLDRLSDLLNRLEAQKSIQDKLMALGKQLGKGQGKLPGRGGGVGGKEAGEGSVDSRRDGRDELDDNGQYARLTGIKGSGPSQTIVESADDGSGTSQRVAEERERTFAKQFESFVQREDVPDDVKDGVREYFTNIHQPEETN